MAEITITMNGEKRLSRKLKNFSTALPANIKKGFTIAGVIFERDMKKKLSRPGRRKGPSSNPYPGVITGRLRGSVLAQVKNTPAGFQLRVGPKVKYAKFLEFGTKKMPAYAFIGPTLRDKLDQAVSAIQKEIAKPLKK